VIKEMARRLLSSLKKKRLREEMYGYIYSVLFLLMYYFTG